MKNIETQTNAPKNLQSSTINVPLIGYHTLELLEGLRNSYNDSTKRINEARDLSKPYDYKIRKRIENLRQYREQIKTEFNYWSELVENWVAKFPEKYILYGDIIREYFCDLDNAVSLQGIIDEILTEDDDKNKKSNNLRAKIRTISLNLIQEK